MALMAAKARERKKQGTRRGNRGNSPSFLPSFIQFFLSLEGQVTWQTDPVKRAMLGESGPISVGWLGWLACLLASLGSSFLQLAPVNQSFLLLHHVFNNIICCFHGGTNLLDHCLGLFWGVRAREGGQREKVHYPLKPKVLCTRRFQMGSSGLPDDYEGSSLLACF